MMVRWEGGNEDGERENKSEIMTVWFFSQIPIGLRMERM